LVRQYRVSTCASQSLIEQEAQSGAIEAPSSEIPNPKQIPISKSHSNSIGCVVFWSFEFEICLKLGAWVLATESAINSENDFHGHGKTFKIFLEGGTRCPQRVGKRTRLRRRISAPSANIVAIVFGEADPPLMQPAPAPQPRWLCYDACFSTRKENEQN
jgi:hypothetical protein